MTPFEGKTYWLIGASEGLGRELAKGLSAAGARVILSARNVERLDGLCGQLPDARALPMDVCDAMSVREAASTLGHIDGLIYNAGAYDPINATSWKTRSALTMVEVNFNGALRVLGEVLPGFLERGGGDITLIGSLAGYRPKIIMGAEIAVPMTKSVVDLGYKCTGLLVYQRDPETDRIKVKPQEAGLGQKDQFCPLQRETTLAQLVPEPRHTASVPARSSVVAVPKRPQVEPVSRNWPGPCLRQIGQHKVDTISKGVLHSAASGVGSLRFYVFQHMLNTGCTPVWITWENK